MSISERALQAIPYDGPKLPETWKWLKEAQDKRRRRVRDSRILRDWLAAEDKEAEIRLQAERWGLTEGRIRGIVEKMNHSGAVVAHMVADVEVLRQVKRDETIRDARQYRDELSGQIAFWEEKRQAGEKWADIEMSDAEGGKYSGTTTKKVPILGHIKALKMELAKSHQLEADALSQYIPKPAQEVLHKGVMVHVEATKEFKEQFSRFMEMNDEKVVVDADSGDAGVGGTGE